MSKIANEYAEALFLLASEADSREEYQEALLVVKTLFSENPEFFDLLCSYNLSLEERLEIIDKTFSASLPENVLSFIKLLCQRRRLKLYSKCVDIFKAMVLDYKKITKARVTTAVELTDNEKSALLKKLEKISESKVIIDYFLDKSILGGLVIEIDGKIIDSSLKKHLNDVKDVIK